MWQLRSDMLLPAAVPRDAAEVPSATWDADLVVGVVVPALDGQGV